jgi:hypothetical protein
MWHFKICEHDWYDLHNWSKFAFDNLHKPGGWARIVNVQAAVRYKWSVHKKKTKENQEVDPCEWEFVHQLSFEGAMAAVCLEVGQTRTRIVNLGEVATSLLKVVKEEYKHQGIQPDDPIHVILQKTMLNDPRWKLVESEEGFLQNTRRLLGGLVIPVEIRNTPLLLLYFCAVARYAPSCLRYILKDGLYRKYIVRGRAMLKKALKRLQPKRKLEKMK